MSSAAIEGEVIESRTVAILPPDVATKVNALSGLDAETQARSVTAMLSHARTGLLAAIAAQDLPQIVIFKQKAAAIQEIAKQVRLGKDMQIDAAEFVRRAQRGLGSGIRDGQGSGTVAGRGQRKGFREDAGLSSISPTDLVPDSYELQDIYAMTDGVSDETFEEVLAEAREEGNLSRANVARKARSRADGDRAPATPDASKAKRKPITTQFLTATYELKKRADILTRLASDDRFALYFDALRDAHLSDLERVHASLETIITKLKG